MFFVCDWGFLVLWDLLYERLNINIPALNLEWICPAFSGEFWKIKLTYSLILMLYPVVSKGKSKMMNLLKLTPLPSFFYVRCLTDSYQGVSLQGLKTLDSLRNVWFERRMAFCALQIDRVQTFVHYWDFFVSIDEIFQTLKVARLA